MARPRKDAGTAPMDRRMLDAFAQMAAHMPMSEITVAAVCRAAGCNKTTFYYHFATFDDLVGRYLDELDAENLLEHAFQVLMSQGAQGLSERELARLSGRYDHLCTLMALNPQGTFARRMHQILRRRVTLALGVASAPTPRQEMLVEFVTGGVASLLAYRGNAGNSIELSQLVDAFYAQIVPVLVQAAGEGDGGSRP